MNRLDAESLLYYDKQVIMMIVEKYGMSYKEATNEFIKSKTHKMLEDLDYGMTEFGPSGIFNIWESEKITGKPENSIYIRED